MIIIDAQLPSRPTLIGHRGASGYRPEHTLAAYQLAIQQGADLIEPDVVVTRDGVLVVRHENEISGTTDVVRRPEFATRRTTKIIDGRELTGWFTEDFTLSELRTLRAVERLPRLRPANTRFDGRYAVPTLAEVLHLARQARTGDGCGVGVAPETKHPSYFASIGLPLERALLAALEDAGFGADGAPVLIQSFETGNLRELEALTEWPLLQLIDSSGAPWDLRAAGDPRTYADLVTPAGLAEIATYADALGVSKNVLIPREEAGRLAGPSPVIGDAHAAGLPVIGWTFRLENQFLPAEFRRGADPAAPGDLLGEIAAFLDAGMDGFFTDHPDLGARATT